MAAHDGSFCNMGERPEEGTAALLELTAAEETALLEFVAAVGTAAVLEFVAAEAKNDDTRKKRVCSLEMVPFIEATVSARREVEPASPMLGVPASKRRTSVAAARAATL